MVRLISDAGDRLVYGCDAKSDVTDLPTTIEVVSGDSEPVPPWSFALIGATAEVYYFTGSAWTKVGPDETT